MEQQAISLYRTIDVRGMDQYAIETLGVDGYLLMTRAAQVSLDTLRQTFADARTLVVLCGSGNNAGDGYVLARLAVDAGMRVAVLALTAPDRLKGNAQRAWQDFVNHGGQVDSFDVTTAVSGDVVVDALLGTGLDRDVSGEYLNAIRWMNQATAPILSLDVPSGLDSDSGLPRPEAVVASVTPTFVAPKIGLYTGQASTYCGKIEINDLQLPMNVVDRFTPVSRLLSKDDVLRCLPPRRRDAHKGVHGRVLIVGGNAGMGGAVVLAAAAALRSGAGTVTVACHPCNREIVAGSMAELMCVGVEHVDALESLLTSCDVVAIGPGLGRDEWGRQLLHYVIKSELPVVIDADGLRLVAEAGKLPLAGARIITPHPGEAAALAAKTSADVQHNRLEIAQLIARKYNAVVALKGAGTIVAEPAKEVTICALGNPGMATAGSGDVLTGITAAIWAQQTDRGSCGFEVTCAAVYVHAQAGDEAAKDGERGLIASDLLAQVRLSVNIKP